MEASNESTRFFANKQGDRLFIEISITGNPDAVVEKIMKSIRTDKELFEGAKCEQMLFRGIDINQLITTAKERAVKAIMDSIIEIENKMTEQ